MTVEVEEAGNQSPMLIRVSSYLTASDLDDILLTLVNSFPVVFALHFSDFKILVLHHCRPAIDQFQMERFLRYSHVIVEFPILACFTIIE